MNQLSPLCGYVIIQLLKILPVCIFLSQSGTLHPLFDRTAFFFESFVTLEKEDFQQYYGENPLNPSDHVLFATNRFDNYVVKATFGNIIFCFIYIITCSDNSCIVATPSCLSRPLSISSHNIVLYGAYAHKIHLLRVYFEQQKKECVK